MKDWHLLVLVVFSIGAFGHLYYGSSDVAVSFAFVSGVIGVIVLIGYRIIKKFRKKELRKQPFV